MNIQSISSNFTTAFGARKAKQKEPRIHYMNYGDGIPVPNIIEDNKDTYTPRVKKSEKTEKPVNAEESVDVQTEERHFSNMGSDYRYPLD